MNRIISYLLVGCLCLLTACSRPSTEPTSVRRVVNVDVGWLFTLTDYVSSPYAATGVADSVLLATPDYADADWRALNVPHDWAIEGKFSKDNPSGTGGGALPGGIGWYRKHFTLASLGLDGLADDERFLIRFDGVYMNSTVWLNGHELGTRPYGYISFEYDMTPYINKEGDNVLAVRVDNSDQPNSRWYSGCGIFRSVYVTAVNPVHIVPWDTYVLAATDTSKAYTYSMVDSLVVTVENTASVDAGTMGLGVGFYDREGNDWDAKVTSVIDNPISVGSAMWAPYKKFGKFIEDKINKMTAEKEASAMDTSKLINTEAAPVEEGAPVPTAKDKAKAMASSFDIAKFCGIFAAIGIALGAIGTFLMTIVTGFLSLSWWQMPLSILAIMLLISGPSMFIAWRKLRKRNLAPLLNANGWAVNADSLVNVLFGNTLTEAVKFPVVKMQDPFAKKGLSCGAKWAISIAVIVVVLAVAAVVAHCMGLCCCH